MYSKLRIRVGSRSDYLVALGLINNWWSQGQAVSTERPDPMVLAVMTDGHITEMAVMS